MCVCCWLDRARSGAWQCRVSMNLSTSEVEVKAEKCGVMIVRHSGGHAVQEDEHSYMLGGENIFLVNVYNIWV